MSVPYRNDEPGAGFRDIAMDSALCPLPALLRSHPWTVASPNEKSLLLNQFWQPWYETKEAALVNQEGPLPPTNMEPDVREVLRDYFPLKGTPCPVPC